MVPVSQGCLAPGTYQPPEPRSRGCQEGRDVKWELTSPSSVLCYAMQGLGAVLSANAWFYVVHKLYQLSVIIKMHQSCL